MKKNKIFLFFEEKLEYLILTLLSLIIFAWFKDKSLYFGGDVTFPLDPLRNIISPFFSWNDNNMGFVHDLTTRVIFPTGFYYFFALLKIPLYIILRLLLYINYFLPGLAMLYLARTIIPQGAGKPMACLVSALYYMYGPWSAAMHTLYLPWGCLPLYLAYYIRALNTNDLKEKIRYSFLFSLALIGVISVLLNYTPVMILILALLIISLFYLFKKEASFQDILKTAGLFVLIFLLVNSYVIISFLIYYFHFGNTILKSVSITQVGTIPSEPMLNVLTATSNIGKLHPYYLKFEYIRIVNVLVTIFAFLGLLINRKKPFFFWCFIIIFIFFVPLALGNNFITGPIFLWLLKNVVYFKTFRTVGELTIIIGLSIGSLLGLSVFQVSQYLIGQGKKLWRYLFLLIVISLIIMNGWIVITGYLFKYPMGCSSSGKVDMPKEYFQLIEYINNQPKIDSSYILWIPGHEIYSSFFWPGAKKYDGCSFAPCLITTPLIHTAYIQETLKPIRLLYFNSNPYLIERILSKFNISYVIIDGYYADRTRPIYKYIELFDRALAKYQRLNFGRLYIYKIVRENQPAIIYAQ